MQTRSPSGSTWNAPPRGIAPHLFSGWLTLAWGARVASFLAFPYPYESVHRAWIVKLEGESPGGSGCDVAPALLRCATFHTHIMGIRAIRPTSPPRQLGIRGLEANDVITAAQSLQVEYDVDVPISAWWDADPSETFWMEITERSDVGANLHAPKRDRSGRENWTHALVQYVRDGDVVYHWWKPPGEEPAMVGYSRAVGSVTSSRITWNAPNQPSWKLALADFVELDQKLTQEDMRRHVRAIKAIRTDLEQTYGRPLYFPFEAGDKRPPRAFQGYLVKLPLALVEELGLPTQTSARSPSRPQRDGRGPTPAPAGAERRRVDAEVNRRIEKHAVGVIEQLLQADGWATVDTGDTRSYDIEAVRGAEVLHVEVKGSATSGVYTVDLTRREVEHARTDRTLLAVVEGIAWQRTATGIETTGGTSRLWWDWEPSDAHLVVTDYRYTLPPDPAL